MFDSLVNTFSRWFNLIVCTYRHPTHYDKVNVLDLKPFDLLFYHSHAIIGKTIQACTNSLYNHVAVYIGGGRVIEAIGEGIVIRTVKESWYDTDKFVLVMRYHNRGIGGEQLKYTQIDKMIEIANYYYKEKERYATEALVQLLLLTQLRENTDEVDRTLLDKAFGAFNELIDGNKEPLDCSELAYRIFNESCIRVRILSDAMRKKFLESKNLILQKYRDFKGMSDVEPDFVTPEDLRSSPDFSPIGLLVKPA